MRYSASAHTQFYRRFHVVWVTKYRYQVFAGPNAGTDPRDYHANLQRDGPPHRERCVGVRPRPYVPIDPAETVAVGCYAADQG